jgi:hypothetical protein
MQKQSDLQRSVAVDGHREPNLAPRLGVDVVAATHSGQSPAETDKQSSKLLARQRSHTAISSTRSDCPSTLDLTSTERQPSTASCTFARSSSSVSPSLAQPGTAGTSAHRPPSSASWTITLIFTDAHPLTATATPVFLGLLDRTTHRTLACTQCTRHSADASIRGPFVPSRPSAVRPRQPSGSRRAPCSPRGHGARLTRPARRGPVPGAGRRERRSGPARPTVGGG